MKTSSGKGVLVLTLLVSFLFSVTDTFAQGITTASISGVVKDKTGQGLVGASVVASHVPSGTIYGTSTRDDGTYNLPGLRVGGPYTVTVTYIGYRKEERAGLTLQLSQVAQLDFQLVEEAVQAGEVVVTGQISPVINPSRTGAATSISREAIEVLPTISRRINDLTRLTPQAIGLSFAGQDNRMNDITVDGSYFNNSFGLGNAPGDRTGVSPISLDAIEQIQVQIAPYDIRQGHFVGAAVNTVTKSGSNDFSGSVYYNYRHQGLVGTKARDFTYNPGTFNYGLIGVRLGGPIIPNQLFFFASFESDKITQPGTTFSANTGGQPATGTTTRVLASDLDALSVYLKNNFSFDPGPYQGYDFHTPATRFTGRLDYNIDDQNKVSVRYTHLDSDTDVLESNSSSLGFGGRRSNNTALNFANSNYKILENIRSIVGEWNSILGGSMANNLIAGYTYNDESRGPIDKLFPLTEILYSTTDQTNYTSFGSEPFTPNNELRYSSYQFQDNFTWYAAPSHTLTFGASVEKYKSENVFFPGSQSVYVYNSLADFYTDANGYLANPARTVAPVTLRRFQVRYNNIPGQTKPVQPLEVMYSGAYAQDEWQVSKDFRLTFGVRFDVASFGNTGFDNIQADTMSFLDENGQGVKYNSGKLPDAHIQISPRLGFNWDVMGDRTTQLRGGTGIFSGPPLYVWISNQIGNTGVLTGFLSVDNTTNYPFNPNPDKYKQTTVNGTPAASYELALTDPDFKFPQLWRTNIAVDQKLPFDLVGTVEYLYNKDINGIYYIDASLKAADSVFTGADTRPRWKLLGANRRINGAIVQDAVVLKNQSVGTSWNIAASLEKPFSDGFQAKVGYSYGESKNTVDPGSIAFGSWSDNKQVTGPNTPGLGFSSSTPGNRLFATFSYRMEYFDIGATTVSLFWEGRNNLWNGFNSAYSYTYSGDMNGDGISGNDLIYIPRDQSEMNFQQYSQTVAGNSRTFTAPEQAAAWDAFISQDPYLSKHRGEYAVRNAAVAPMVYRADLSVIQEIFTEFLGKKNSLQIRADFLNVGNLINKNWGVGQRPVNFATTSAPTAQPLSAQGAPSQGRPLFRLRTKPGTNELMTDTFEYSNLISDVFQIQIGIRYAFN